MLYTHRKPEPLHTFVWTAAQISSAERYSRSGQMRIVCQLREDLFEDQFVCLVDCDSRTRLLLHFL
jgi:hypothetical protein